ncbi:MAG: iron-containing alcohol dehydrogenase [Clostridiales bacterium]|nr:iron-containing alcohol dehydrogenase [Clostridiales bacterium]
MLNFNFHTPTAVYFGKDTHLQVGKIISEYGYNKIMMQYGKQSIKKSGLYDQVIASLKEYNIQVIEMGGVEPNPKLQFVNQAIKVAREQKVQMILAVGGGSVIDSSKFTALGVKYDGNVWDFTCGKAVPQDALPVGCILTHSAAGSEMSNSAVLSDLTISKKKGCGSQFNRCKFAILNPELTYSVSKYQTACGVVDMMTHTMERYFTPQPPVEITDGIAESLLRTIISAGKIAIENPTDYEARATLMWASSLSHNNLTDCGRGGSLIVHQLEHAVSGEFDSVAHGAGLAVLYPAWAKYVYKANPKRFSRFFRNVFGITEQDDMIACEKGIKAMSEYFISLGMPSKLSDLGVPKEKAERLADLCTNGKTRILDSQMKLGFNECKEIFESCY